MSNLSLRAKRSNPVRVLATSLIIALVSAAFSPAVTGCSGAPGSANPDLAAGSNQKGTIYYLDDHLGSAQILTDSEGNVVYEGSTAPYGLDLDGLGTGATEGQGGDNGPDYSYTTKELDDETGLIYFGARYYSPEMGRWISPDPLFLEDPKATSNTPQEGNLYSYVRGNPTSLIDNNGDFAIGPAIGVAVMAAWYILSDPNVANAPAPGEPLIANPTPSARAESYAIDAAVGYLGYRAFQYAFVYALGAEKAVSKIGPSAASNIEQSISVYHGSINNYTWIKSVGLNPFKKAYVSRDAEAAYNAISPLRYEVSQGIAKDIGIIESRIPKSFFDKHLADSEMVYDYGFGANFGGRLNSTQIILDTAEKVDLFNKYISK
ncbi:MAG: RHS repeat-associated core domain-containing protein [Patescibacteria group bacterium]